jgi:galactonate dehydratase
VRITDVKTFLVHDQERAERNYTFVKVYTDEGLTGLGEAGINGKELAVKGLVDTYRPVLVGMDASRTSTSGRRSGEDSSSGVATSTLPLWRPST